MSLNMFIHSGLQLLHCIAINSTNKFWFNKYLENEMINLFLFSYKKTFSEPLFHFLQAAMSQKKIYFLPQHFRNRKSNINFFFFLKLGYFFYIKAVCLQDDTVLLDNIKVLFGSFQRETSKKTNNPLSTLPFVEKSSFNRLTQD